MFFPIPIMLPFIGGAEWKDNDDRELLFAAVAFLGGVVFLLASAVLSVFDLHPLCIMDYQGRGCHTFFTVIISAMTYLITLVVCIGTFLSIRTIIRAWRRAKDRRGTAPVSEED